MVKIKHASRLLQICVVCITKIFVLRVVTYEKYNLKTCNDVTSSIWHRIIRWMQLPSAALPICGCSGVWNYPIGYFLLFTPSGAVSGYMWKSSKTRKTITDFGEARLKPRLEVQEQTKSLVLLITVHSLH